LVLRRKGIGADAQAVRREAVLAERYPELAGVLAEVGELRKRAAQLALAQAAETEMGIGPQEFARLTQRQEQLEAQLAAKIPEVRLDQQLTTANRQAVANALPEGTALIDIVRLPQFVF